MPNNSASGGYLVPSLTTPLPGGLSFNQFMQTVMVGISGIDPKLVRPNWQQNPPEQPGVDVNWIAFGLNDGDPDASAYVWIDDAGIVNSQRHAQLEIQCSFYGPDGYALAELVRDGFQVQQNLEALNAANMGFTDTGRISAAPDLINERWVQKYVMSVFIKKETLRTYPIVTFVSASGKIHTVLESEEYLLEWDAQTRET